MSLKALCGVLLIVSILTQVAWLASDPRGLKDLGSLLHSGAAHYRGLNPYQYYSWVMPQPISREALNLNPPLLVYMFDPLSRLDSQAVKLVFLFGSIALFAISVGLLLRAYPQRRNAMTLLVVLSMAGLWHMLWYLQIYAPLILAVTVAWLLIRREHLWPAGILLGLVVTVKPNYAVVPILLLCAGYPRLALPAIATAAGLSAIPLFLDGPGIYKEWLQLTREFTGLTWSSNASLISVGDRFGAHWAGAVLALALFVAVAFWQARCRPGALDALAGALMTALLLGPVSWAGYTLLLLPYILSRTWNRRTWVALLLLDKPFSVTGVSMALGILGSTGVLHAPGPISLPPLHFFEPIVGSAYAWAVMLLLGGLVIESWRAAESRRADERPDAVTAILTEAAVRQSRPAQVEPALSPAAD